MRSMKLALASVATLAAVSLTSTAAHAESKSWGAIKKKVTAVNTLVVSVDFVPMRKLPSFDTTVSSLLSMQSDVKGALDMVKTKCSIDVTKVISDLTLVMEYEKAEEGVVALGVYGANFGVPTPPPRDLTQLSSLLDGASTPFEAGLRQVRA